MTDSFSPVPANLDYIRPLQVTITFRPEDGAHRDHWLVESSTPITRDDLEMVGNADLEGITYLGRTQMGTDTPGQYTLRPEGPYWTVVSKRVKPKSVSELFAELRQELGGVNGAVNNLLNELAERAMGEDESAE